MDQERVRLAIIALIAAVCAGFTFDNGYGVLTVILMLESVVASMLALL
jgi:hypothetical protein